LAEPDVVLTTLSAKREDTKRELTLNEPLLISIFTSPVVVFPVM